jgi:TetR/AcrR family transcriptional regulator, transcriptional repressor for nem operon
MTRTKPAEQRRADLLAAGQALFLAKGIAATSLEDITSGAGVSKGLFYLYFRTKEDLVLALQDQFSADFAGRIRAAADAEPDWAAKLDACVQASFEYYRDLHALHVVLFHHAPHAGVPHEHETEPSPVAVAIRDVLVAGVAAGAYDIEDPEVTAVLCYASMHAFDPGFGSGPGLTDARLVRAAQQLFRHAAGITADAPARGTGPRSLQDG